MELKEYQQKALKQVKGFLEALDKEIHSGNLKHASEDAWEAVGSKDYKEARNGLDKDLPNFCLKIPTGGGKTLLAVKVIDLVNHIYLRKRNCLVLWIVPTTQIYNQTIKNLRTKEHPYRQYLDIASGGKTLIVEKGDKFTPLDIEENLVILMLMLPSASRTKKEELKVFRDSGAFQEFFPAEDDRKAQQELLSRVINLDTFGNDEDFWGRQIKTSLGNVIRLLNPMVILDESHKGKSPIAEDTLKNLNPSIVVELSATPHEQSNILVDILGRELNQEEMIKLDLHVINKASTKWEDTMLASKDKLDLLETKAREHEANTGIYIRPICLIQAERTGKDQRGGKYVHSEDVKEYLIKGMGIPEEEIAIKTSEKDELKIVDDIGGLMSKDCKIRYIITKQALQEGWDCAFAYVLSILTNPSSKNALTQLVGRILRQPYARKTKVDYLDESYVFCFQQRGNNLLEEIKKGFGQEGLGDLHSKVTISEEMEAEDKEKKIYAIRDKFKSLVDDIILPFFVTKDENSWRLIEYETDILNRVEWEKVDLESLYNLTLSSADKKDVEHLTTLSEDIKELIKQKKPIYLKEGGLILDPVFIARQLLEIVPNPWLAYEIGEKVLGKLHKKYDVEQIINNLVFIIEETKKRLEKERDRLAQGEFLRLLIDKKIRFLVAGQNLGFKLKTKYTANALAKRLNNKDGAPLQKSLFEFLEEDELNEDEKEVAWYLEDQEKLLFWYRNLARTDYPIQGWKKQKVYPDFIFTKAEDQRDFDEVFVIETKGVHLKASEDTEYKKSVLNICNEQAKSESFARLFGNKKIHYELVYGDEWERKLNELLN